MTLFEPPSNFLRFVEIVAPGRDDVIVMLEAYFDESYGDTGLLCVAGYVFTKSRCREFDKRWRQMLLRRDRRLPFFRMSACAHGSEPFDKIDRAERDLIAREAIELIKRYAVIGIAETIDETSYEVM